MTPSAKALCERLTAEELPLSGNYVGRRRSYDEIDAAALIRAQAEQIERLSAALHDARSMVGSGGQAAIDHFDFRHADALRIAREQG